MHAIQIFTHGTSTVTVTLHFGSYMQRLPALSPGSFNTKNPFKLVQ